MSHSSHPIGPLDGLPDGPHAGPRRVLLVRLSHLGDIAQALPLLHAVRERWPEVELGWAIQPEFADLVAPLARVFPFDRGGGLGAWTRLRRELRAWGPDLILDAQGNWKSAVAARLARHRARGIRSLAFERSAWQEPLAARVTRPELARSTAAPHLVDRCAALAQYVTGRTLPVRLDPCLDSAECARGAALLSQLTTAPAPVLLHPGVAGDPRSWPIERFAQLARRLMRAGKPVVILTGPAEAQVGASLRAAVPGAAHLVGQRGLRELAALLAAVHDRSGQLVVGDSGPAHIAASVGLPVVLLAGPEDPLRTGPWPTVAQGSSTSPHRLAAPPIDLGESVWVPRPIDSIDVQDVVVALG